MDGIVPISKSIKLFPGESPLWTWLMMSFEVGILMLGPNIHVRRRRGAFGIHLLRCVLGELPVIQLPSLAEPKVLHHQRKLLVWSKVSNACYGFLPMLSCIGRHSDRSPTRGTRRKSLGDLMGSISGNISSRKARKHGDLGVRYLSVHPLQNPAIDKRASFAQPAPTLDEYMVNPNDMPQTQESSCVNIMRKCKVTPLVIVRRLIGLLTVPSKSVRTL
jgi:hypothetical protein